MMMVLGTFVFELHTAAYQELVRNTAYRWQAANRIGREPAQQFLGPGEKTISLPGLIYPELTSGKQALDDIKSLADTGEPQIMIDADGWIRGRWVIDNVEETETVFTSDGKPRKIAFTISLKSYGEDI